MLDHPVIIALIVSGLLALLLIFDWRVTGYLRRIFQTQPSRPPELIDLAAESTDEGEDPRPTWLMLTLAMPVWNADMIAEICSEVWHVPVNQHEHDFNFVIGEAPCLMLRNEDWHYLLTIGDEPYMDPEQIPELADAAVRAAFVAHQSWFSLSVVGAPSNESLHGKDALRRSAQLMAALSDDQCLVLLGIYTPEPWAWTAEVSAQLHAGNLSPLIAKQK